MPYGMPMLSKVAAIVTASARVRHRTRLGRAKTQPAKPNTEAITSTACHHTRPTFKTTTAKEGRIM